MPQLEIEKIERYLNSVLGADVTILALTHLGDPPDKLIKGFGYGPRSVWITRLPMAATDDVTSLTLNYFVFSLQRSERLEGSFEKLFRRFWERYLAGSGDREMFGVVAPFFAFRGLVMASPLWYPALKDTLRRRLLAFRLHGPALTNLCENNCPLTQSQSQKVGKNRPAVPLLTRGAT